MTIRTAIFDLDGVIVDTAKYHYLAWRRLAAELGFEFSELNNERLKGVSRMQSLDILLEVGGLLGKFSEEQLSEMASRKNAWYVEYISKIDESEILKGTTECIHAFRNAGVKTALGSASKNAMLILNNLHLVHMFDAIIDGTKTSKAKPDPEVFMLCAETLGVHPGECVVFEDAQAGIWAARRAGMHVVAVGQPENLSGYDRIVPGLYAVDIQKVIADYSLPANSATGDGSLVAFRA